MISFFVLNKKKKKSEALKNNAHKRKKERKYIDPQFFNQEMNLLNNQRLECRQKWYIEDSLILMVLKMCSYNRQVSPAHIKISSLFIQEVANTTREKKKMKKSHHYLKKMSLVYIFLFLLCLTSFIFKVYIVVS